MLRERRREGKRYALSYNSGQSTELQNIARHKQERVQYFFLLTRRSTSVEYDDQQRQDAEDCDDEIEDVEWIFPKLLFGNTAAQIS